MKMQSVFLFIILIIASLNAHASSLVGESIYGCLASLYTKDCSLQPTDGGNTFSPDTAIISESAVEFEKSLTSPEFIRTADFGKDSLKLTFGYEGTGLGGQMTGFWFFKLLDNKQRFTNVQLSDSNTLLNGLVFTGNSISIITDTITIKPGESLHWDFQIETQPVPIPAAFWLFVSSFAGLMSFVRKAGGSKV